MKNLLAAVILSCSTAAWADSVTASWSAKCKSCHGEDGRGDTKMGKKEKVQDLTTAKWQSSHTDDQIRSAISDGVPDTKMKPFKEKLDAARIDELVKFVRGLKT